MRAPWGFVRDTDHEWNVKVVSEESNFVFWQLRPEAFRDPEQFRRLKRLGFESRAGIETFMRALAGAVDATDHDLEATAAMVSAVDQPLGDDLSAADLREYADAWMRDVHEFANLSHWLDAQDDERTAFDLAVREFRHERPWLRADVDFAAGEAFGYRHPTDGTVLYYVLRESPAGDEQVLFAGNMEGVPVEVSPSVLAAEIDALDADTGGWDVALAAPDVRRRHGGSAFTVDNGQAVVWTRSP
jgi:hypothetical protein